MTKAALFAVLPYGAGQDGTLVPQPAIEAFSEADAREKAERVAPCHAASSPSRKSGIPTTDGSRAGWRCSTPRGGCRIRRLCTIAEPAFEWVS